MKVNVMKRNKFKKKYALYVSLNVVVNNNEQNSLKKDAKSL